MENSFKFFLFLVTQISFGFAVPHLQEHKDCLYMDPLDCNAYYQCVDNIIEHKLCPSGTQWNPKNNACDVNELCERDLVPTSFEMEENQDDLHLKQPAKTPVRPPIRPPVRPPIISHPVTSTKYVCPNKNPSSQFFAHPNCNRFYEEVGELTIDRLCPGTGRWAAEENCCSETSQCVYNESLYRPNAILESNASAQLKQSFMFIFLQVWVATKAMSCII